MATISTSDSANVRKLTVTESSSFDNGALTTDGAGNLSAVVGITASGAVSGTNITGSGVVQGASVKSTTGKITMSALGDILDLSAAQGVLGLGPTSTSLKLNFQAKSQTLIDSGAGGVNQINAYSRFTGSANSATNHLYTGATPDLALQMTTGTATAWSCGTFTSTQCTPAMTSAAAYIAMATKS